MIKIINYRCKNLSFLTKTIVMHVKKKKNSQIVNSECVSLSKI